MLYASASQILLAAGQTNFPRGPKLASGEPYFCLASQMYLFTINSQSLAGHFETAAGHSWPAGPYLRSGAIHHRRMEPDREKEEEKEESGFTEPGPA